MMKNRSRRVTPEEFDWLRKKAQTGDTVALGELCSHTYAMVYRFIYAKVNHSEDAEDLASEVCVRVVKELSRVKGSFIGWVFKISGNMVIDYYRRRDVRSRHESEMQHEEIAEGGSSPDRAVMHSEIRQLLPMLTDEQQQVITLKFLEGFTTEEIAKALDKPPGAIRALQFRALSSLRNMVDENGR
jgi:RNA polymerase sigma-70 factor (ECF subfamily)